MNDAHELTIGDTVRWSEGATRWSGGTTHYGTIRRIGEKSLTAIQGDGTATVLRKQRNGFPCTYVSPEAMTLRKWIDAKPKTPKIGAYYYPADGHLDVNSMRVESPEQIDQIIADLATLQAWLAVKPEASQ